MRQPLKELAQLVIDRHAGNAALPEDGAGLSDAERLSPIQESNRQQVLGQLANKPGIQRAFVNRFKADGTMIVTLGIRGVGTGELVIPAGRLSQSSLDDYSALLASIEARSA